MTLSYRDYSAYIAHQRGMYHRSSRYVLPPNRRNMIVTEECTRCKNFAFPVLNFPCASYNRNHAHRHLVKTHLTRWSVPCVNYNSPAYCYQSKTNTKHVCTQPLNNQHNLVDITDYSVFSHKPWHGSDLTLLRQC